MEREELTGMATPEHVAAAVRRHRPKRADGHGHMGPGLESVREVSYKGHTITVVTTYRIEVDGNPVEGHVMVDNSGLVHYHAIPNQQFPSAVGLVKRIIDLAGDDLPPPARPAPSQGHEGMGGHQGMDAPGAD